MHPYPAIGLAALAALAALALPAGASARTVRLPEKKPLVSFEVPDDWTVTPVGNGLELSAPDHTSVIETGVVKRAKGEIIAWQKGATQRMKAFGVSFDPKRNPEQAGKGGPTDIGHIFNLKKDDAGLSVDELPSWSMAPPLPQADAPPAPDQAAKPPAGEARAAEAKSGEAKSGEAKAVDGKTADAKPAEAKPVETKTAETKPAEAKPAETKPAEAGSADGKLAAGRSAESRAAEAKPAESKPAESKSAEAGKRPHFRSVVLYGAVLDGKPVDVQFLDFSAGGGSAFLMQQQSSSSDDRAAAIVNSVRLLR